MKEKDSIQRRMKGYLGMHIFETVVMFTGVLIPIVAGLIRIANFLENLPRRRK